MRTIGFVGYIPLLTALILFSLLLNPVSLGLLRAEVASAASMEMSLRQSGGPSSEISSAG